MARASKLRAVPDRPRRMLGLVRVSKQRDEMISPELQEHKIREYCKARGHQLVAAPDGEPFLYGIDESGSRAKSSWWRKLDQAVVLVESGEYDGLVVWKFHRVARNRLRWNVALDRVESAGGVLESATEDFDTTTAAGRLGRGISGEFNAFQADVIGEGWVEAHERRVRAGLPHSGRRRWGYTYDRAAKVHRPHPEQGPVLAELYRRFTAGESMYGLARWMNAHGWPSPGGTDWSATALRNTLDNGFAAGLFRYRQQLHQGKHEPLITAEEWQAYLDARQARRQLHPRTERSQYLLSGLVRCARCGKAMAASKQDPGMKLAKNGKRYRNGQVRYIYRCERGVNSGTCRGGSIKIQAVEDHVMAYVRDLASAVDLEVKDHVVVDVRRQLLEVEEERLARELGKVTDQLVRLALRDAERPMPPEAYAAARDKIEDRATELRDAMEAAGRTHRRAPRDRSAQAAELLDQWDELPVAGRREILRGLLDCVLVRTGPEPYVRVVDWTEARA